MLIVLTILASVINVCISGNETDHNDCDSWPPLNSSGINKILFNSSDFSLIKDNLEPNEYVFIGVGNVPDLPIDLSTLITVANVSDNVNLNINVTQPEVNDIVTFDFEVAQFDDLQSLTFYNLKLKPFNTTMIHTTSTVHTYTLVFNDVIFLSGYVFDSDIFKPLSQFDFYDVTIIELKERWIAGKHTPVFSNFYFCSEYTQVYNESDRESDILFYHKQFMGKIDVVTEFMDHINFKLNSTEDLPTLGFKIYSSVNNVTFSGGWNENITLKNEGIQIVYDGTKTIYINCNEDDTDLPIGFSYGKHDLYYSRSNTNSIPSGKKSPRHVIVNSPSDVTFTVPWNITEETTFAHTDKSGSIFFEHMRFCNESSLVYRTDVKNKRFQVNELSIMDNLTFTFPGKNDININGNFNVRPGVSLTIDSKIRFDKNTAFLKIIWNMKSGFPTIKIADYSLVTAKGIPNIIFSDEEPIENIANANETYEDILCSPVKIMCGLEMIPIDNSKISFISDNPSFSENGVWEYFWALDNDGEPTGTDNKTQEMCFWVNMTELPEVPIIPVPTASKDPAAVNRNAMIGMIVTFFALFVSAILGFFSKFLKQNKRDREKEKQDELEKELREKELEETESNFDDSDITAGMDESELSDRYMSFEQDLSLNSDDDFSTTVNSSISQNFKSTKNNNNDNAPKKSLSRKNTLKNNDLLGDDSKVETEKLNLKKTKSKSRTNLIDKQESIANKLTNDDINTPLLNQSDDSNG